MRLRPLLCSVADLNSDDVQLRAPVSKSPSLFTHNFVLKLSLGRPVASQRAVSSSANTRASALYPCNLQSQYAYLLFLSSFHSFRAPKRKVMIHILRSSYPSPAPYTHPSQHSCKRAAAGGRYRKRSCHGGCWMTIRILWCRRGRCLCSGIGAARVVAGCGVCLPIGEGGFSRGL